MDQTEIIAHLNDTLRSTMLTGKVVMTAGIASLPDDIKEQIITRVRAFNDFSEDNDPYGEHDFGAFTVDGVGKVFWKIDYYNHDLTAGSEDPANTRMTRRVLTILLAEEW